tara:strand:+ start:4552 stop:5151 length:600 start_codon:yes stop_codon:yes gene_type:complete
MDILYYSNYCKHSQSVIQTLVKSNLTDKISFICIDKRKRDETSGNIVIILENGDRVMMPPNIHSVPSLLLIKEQYRIIEGDSIITHLHPEIRTNKLRESNIPAEPTGYMLNSYTAGSNIMSEKFTSYSLTPDELSAKGNGERREMYNYISAKDNMNVIDTPPDTYKPDKVSNDITLDTLQQKRIDDIGQSKPPGQVLNI